jgi:DNA-binding transcriptional LysR family regulator
VRSTRSVELTPAGEAMLVYSRSMLSIAERARQQLSRPSVEGSLRLGLVEDFATAKLSAVLGIFRKQHPCLELTLSTGLNYTLFQALDAGELDVVLAKRPVGKRRGNLVLADSLVWVGDPNLIESNRYVPVVTNPAPSDTRNLILQVLSDAGYTWNIVVQSTGLFGQAAAVEAGLGVGVFTSHFVPQGLTRVPADIGLPELPSLEYVIDSVGGDGTDAIAFFVEVLTGVARQIAASWRGEGQGGNSGEVNAGT